MKRSAKPPDNAPPHKSRSGIQVGNTLSMALRSQGTGRKRLYLILLALLGTVSSIFTFLSMFTPLCNITLILLFAGAVLVFFSYHAEHPAGMHVTLLLFLLLYVFVFFRTREELASGLMYLMNDVYQTIYMTDWEYFQSAVYYPPETSTTLVICVAVVPIAWLLSYAVMRYQNFFLSLLVTFPFVEIGFFFGIAPDHIPAAGLFAFWCGMCAVQLAGAGNYQNNQGTGFLRRRNAFQPIAGMRFLLTERSGLLSACLTFALLLLAEHTVTAMQYQRPERVRQMRTDFQHYAASIDWNDPSTIFPFLDKEKGAESVPEEVVELGRSEKREFENKPVSNIAFSQKPAGRTYLKFSTYANYQDSTWSILPEETYDVPIFQTFETLNYYPAEFLFGTAQLFGWDNTELRLYNANETLANCIPYGFRQDAAIHCQRNDSILTETDMYTVFAGDDYETILSAWPEATVSAGELLASCSPAQQEILETLITGNHERSIRFPIGSERQQYAPSALLGSFGYTDFVREHYTSIPDTPEMQQIRAQYADILDDYDASTATYAQTVQVLRALRERLCDIVTYSLTPGKTPPSRDYLAYFLLENKAGYCTHYATAGTILARMAGIPARYCEGYLVDNKQLERAADGSGYVTEILDSNAHAWPEVYLEGVGWIPFEFTFSYFTPPEELEETSEETEIPTEIQPEIMTEFVPVESEVPETFLRTEPSAPDVPQAEHLQTVLTVLGAAAFLLLTIWLFWLARRYALRKHQQRLHQKDTTAAAQYTWHYLLRLMQECGVNIQAGTAAALSGEMQEKCSAYLPEDMLQVILQTGTKLRYSPHALTAEELVLLRTAAASLADSMYQNNSVLHRFLYKWIRHYV